MDVDAKIPHDAGLAPVPSAEDWTENKINII